MQVTTGDAINAVQALNQLANEKMPVKLAMQVRRVARGLAPIADDYNAERQKLISQYAEQNGDGPKTDERGYIVFKDPDGFSGAHRELLAVEHEVEAGLDVDALEASGLEVAPSLLLALGPLLVE